jgi:alpha-amylase/alpha-mannosidase (GH57 family)
VTKRSEVNPQSWPEWYLEQFRSHVEAIHELFKACPPKQWKPLSQAIRDALANVGKKFGLKIDIYAKTEDKSPQKNRASQESG